MSTLLAPTFLFRFATPCYYLPDIAWQKRTELEEKYSLPHFGGLDGKNPYAEMRCAWNESGFVFYARVQGKQQSVWCRDTRIEDSDGLQIWIDTRDTKNIHRAGRFCHRFGLMPKGAGRMLDQPVFSLLAISRAKESPREITERSLLAKSRIFQNGYDILAFIPKDALTGYNPADHNKLGFCYAFIDRELGLQTFSVGAEFPLADDPSLWPTLELVK
jgi:hypothetical protein